MDGLTTDFVSSLTSDRLLEMEQKEKTAGQKTTDLVISLLPVLCGGLAVAEYLLIPDKYQNNHPERYLCIILAAALIYFGFLIAACLQYTGGKKKLYQKLRYKAPLYSAIFLMLAALDYLTLKTGKLMYPFIPWVNDVINVVIADWANLAKSTLFSLRLLFMGYFIGAAVGLVCGIACGYSKTIRYWISPVIRILGPIPTATWLPLIMILAPSLFGGSVFMVSMGVWFSVTVAAMTGVSNVDPAYFEAAKLLGASDRKLILHVAIPHAMPNILQGMTQGMSSACISLMIAEMLGVEAGLGWYITWAKAWAAYNKMFAAIVVICIVFGTVTKTLDAIKKRALRWQT